MVDQNIPAVGLTSLTYEVEVQNCEADFTVNVFFWPGTLDAAVRIVKLWPLHFQNDVEHARRPCSPALSYRADLNPISLIVNDCHFFNRHFEPQRFLDDVAKYLKNCCRVRRHLRFLRSTAPLTDKNIVQFQPVRDL